MKGDRKMNNLEKIINGLNTKQREAATQTDGKFLVLASAGSGKTAVLTKRVSYLIALGISPWEIVAVTFTKKAANEIRERVQKEIGESALDVNMGTFHSLCMRILLSNQKALGMNNLTILDEGEAKKIIADIAMTQGYIAENDIRDIQSILDGWSNEGWAPEDVATKPNVVPSILAIYEEYVQFKRLVGYIDFNDILSLTAKLFRIRPDILEKYSRKFRYILVDECQDLNNVQMLILQQLSSYHQNYMLIGDDLQCQPAGTKVLMVDGTEKNIEDVVKGDKLVSYMSGDSRKFTSTTKATSRSWNARGYEVLATSSHDVEKVITIATETGKVSSYAPNHIAYVRFKNETDRWITYVMGNEKGQYRVGKTTLFTTGKHVYSGIRNRMHQEKCTHAWILGSFESKQEAWFTEQIAAVQFGIPQITFQLNKVDYSETFVERLFASIPNMDERLKNVLSFFGREVDFPIAVTSAWRGTQSRHISKTSLFTVEASNIMPDCMEVLEYDANDRKGHYVTITDVTIKKEPTTVYGLSVEGYHNYVADGILTHNCIYSFRGSNVNNIMSIREYDTDVQTILLEQNYRSSGTIVRASNAFISHNKNQLEKVSFTENDKGWPLYLYESTDETREADFIVATIKGLMKNHSYDYSDFAVIYRSNYLSRTVELALSMSGIPYDIVAGSEFYEREEIKTLVSYLRALDNPMDDLAYERILNKPKRGIGDTTINRIKLYATEAGIPFSKALEYVDDIPKINRPTKENIANFLNILTRGRNLVESKDAKVSDILNYIILSTHFMEQYDIERSADLDRIQNIQELKSVAINFDQREREELVEEQTVLTQFLTETALYVKEDKEEDPQTKVSLTTAHSSKGLEYKCVFVIGVEAGIFPSRMVKDEEEFEEERRLFYVSMTRAKELLFISYNVNRYRQGQIIQNGPSRFLGEIPIEYIRHLGIKNNGSSKEEQK